MKNKAEPISKKTNNSFFCDMVKPNFLSAVMENWKKIDEEENKSKSEGNVLFLNNKSSRKNNEN